jgi:hypothetical protein
MANNKSLQLTSRALNRIEDLRGIIAAIRQSDIGDELDNDAQCLIENIETLSGQVEDFQACLECWIEEKEHTEEE